MIKIGRQRKNELDGITHNLPVEKKNGYAYVYDCNVKPMSFAYIRTQCVSACCVFIDIANHNVKLAHNLNGMVNLPSLAIRFEYSYYF